MSGDKSQNPASFDEGNRDRAPAVKGRIVIVSSEPKPASLTTEMYAKGGVMGLEITRPADAP